MRNTFIDLVHKNYKKNDNFYFLTGDLGFSVLEKIKQKLGKKFINVGICENNMSLMAVGLSEKRNKVFVYTIAPFVGLRCIEIIKNYLNNEIRNISIIAVGSSYSYGIMGPTHHVNEDVSIISNFKNVYLANPGNIDELKYIFSLQKKIKNPFYIRLNKDNYTSPKKYNFVRKNSMFHKKGGKERINIITSGIAQKFFFEAIDGNFDYSFFNHISIPELNFINFNKIRKEINCSNTLILIDFYNPVYIINQIKEYLINNKKNYILIAPDLNKKLKIGDQDYLFHQNGFSKKNIINQINKLSK